MTGADVTLVEGDVLVAELPINDAYLQVAISLPVTSLAAIRFKIIDYDAGRNAGRTFRATWCVDQSSTAPKA